ncbi:hypothetical protein E2562_020671 [Oryza meyeriana var. granulata]|uniref:Uncharacterized protein n=1 Tax=Oryza meyeriana var. granulata TaxID=110450 RepID=A0A6G1EB17_9ORYZ|nr:hypothetical protein E2562_020671 [Oryza meyeriana var. granulata]
MAVILLGFSVVLKARRKLSSKTKSSPTKYCLLYIMILYLDSLRIENINVPSEGEDVAPGSQPEEENKEDNGDDKNNGGVPDAEIAEDHVQANKEESDLEGEIKEDDADDGKKEHVPDAEKAKDCPKGSKEQQESQLPTPAQSTPTQEEESVEDYPFLARQSTPSILEDVPTFNLRFDSTQETVEEVTITNEDYGSFTTEDYEWVGREADEAIALKALEDFERLRRDADEASAFKASEDFERLRREADEASAKKDLEDTTPLPHEYNKRIVKPEKFQRSRFIDYANKKQFIVSHHVYLLNDQLDMNDIKISEEKMMKRKKMNM